MNRRFLPSTPFRCIITRMTEALQTLFCLIGRLVGALKAWLDRK